jgi:hypothetical protein
MLSRQKAAMREIKQISQGKGQIMDEFFALLMAETVALERRSINKFNLSIRLTQITDADTHDSSLDM